MPNEENIDFFTTFLEDMSDNPSFPTVLGILKGQTEPMHVGDIADLLRDKMTDDQVFETLLILREIEFVSSDDDINYSLTSRGMNALNKQ
jgi:hypothetical protein